MQLGDILTARGLTRPEDIEKALRRQKECGGRLGENLVALGIITAGQLDSVLQDAPPAPKSIADTDIRLIALLNLMMKAMYGGSLETPSAVAEALKLPAPVVGELLQEAIERKLVETLGVAGPGGFGEPRYALSESGRRRAVEALAQSQYVGPAPVSLDGFHDRILRQKITNERIDREDIANAFSSLVISEEFVRRLGPAINSGRCILLYGPPGNGKTTVADRIADIFEHVVFIPYCIEVEGQIIKVFDPGVHEALVPVAGAPDENRSIRRDEFDRRWVACRRPVIVTGGELTLQMLDLSFNTIAKYYEAPLHVKALGGTFVIDDFGRQIVSPEELLNRWMVPLQSRVDYLKLHTGKSFSIPFDELVIFSTNLSPGDLMDPAILRRIPYKLETEGPTRAAFEEIFRAVAAAEGLVLTDEILELVLHELLEVKEVPLACYQPRFLVDQVLAACKYEGVPPAFTRERVADALSNLHVRRSDAPGGATAAKAGRTGGGLRPVEAA